MSLRIRCLHCQTTITLEGRQGQSFIRCPSCLKDIEVVEPIAPVSEANADDQDLTAPNRVLRPARPDSDRGRDGSPRAHGSLSATGYSSSAGSPDRFPSGAGWGGMLPGYQLEGLLGEGAMGVVYQARQVAADRPVAIKMIAPGARTDERYRALFQAEARAVAAISHPHVVQIYEVGEHQGMPFFSMEFCTEGSLEGKLDAIPNRPLPTEEAVCLLEQVARGVHEAHCNGIIHRDLKPGNILLSAGGFAKVSDFGIAKRLDAQVQLTRTGMLVGTPHYMSPEQAAGKGGEIGPATDVYALGVLLFQCLTGRRPFEGNTDEVLYNHLHTEAPSPRKYNGGLPRDLETIVGKCLQKEPQRRYVSAEALADDLRRFREREPILARPTGRWEWVLLWSRRRPALAAVVILAVLLVGVVGIAGIVTRLWIHAESEKQRAVQAEETADTLRKEEEVHRRTAEQLADEREKERIKADKARLAEGDARREVEHLKGTIDTLLYANRLTLAQREWELGHLTQARNVLKRTRPDLRDWEYHYLSARLHPGRSLEGHTSGVSGVCFSPDGKRIVSSGWDKTVRVWDASTGARMLTLEGHTQAVLGVGYSHDNQRIVTGGWDRTVRVWDAHRGILLHKLQDHTHAVTSVRFSRDSKRIVSGGLDQTVKVWDASKGTLIRSINRAVGPITGVSLSPDGNRIAASSNNRVQVWDVDKGAEVFSMRSLTGRVGCVQFSPDGKCIVSGGGNTVKVWDARDGTELHSFSAHQTPLRDVQFSPDGKLLVTCSDDHEVKVWNAHKGPPLHTFMGHSLPLTSVRFSPDGERIVSGSWDRTVKVWTLTKASAIPTIKGHAGTASSVRFSPDGKWLVSGGEDHAVKVWDAFTGAERYSLTGHRAAVLGVCFNPDGSRIASCGKDRTVKVWDARTGKLLRTLSGHREDVLAVAFSPDGQRIVSGGKDNVVKVWDANTGTERFTIAGHAWAVTSVAYSPDGRRIVTGSWDRTAKVWDAQTGALLHSLTGHSHHVTSVCYSPDGRQIATGSLDKTVRVWDAVKYTRLAVLEGHGGWVASVGFSPSGRRIVTGSSDQTVKVWDVARSILVLSLDAHPLAVTSASFDPQGRRIVSSGDEGSIKVWDASASREWPPRND